jgi:endogenous inhibitor of DNA gyrase (YacG/DUF329 family)
MLCPTCKKTIKAPGKEPGASSEPRSSTLPFCSARCRSADLGSWLNESYRVPTATDDEDLDVSPPPDEDGGASTN